MNTPSPDAPRPVLEVQGARASSVIVHRVPTEYVERFVAWQHGITGAIEGFPGYQATDMYPPADPTQPLWVMVIHFTNAETLRRWLDSPLRAEWTAKLPAEIADFRLKTLSAGFGPWFAGLVDDGPLPHWKMALAVLFALYPTAMVLTLFLWPHMQILSLAAAMLISNAASSSFLEWVAMPLTTRLLGPWLRANRKEDSVVTVVGLILILGALGLMTLLFHQLT